MIQSVPGTQSCGGSSLAAETNCPVLCFLITLWEWHLPLCEYSLAESQSQTGKKKKRKSKTERESSRSHHAKYINISIWCLILPPLPLTPLAPVAPITGLEWALPGQGHVVGVCYESATWSHRCLRGPGRAACWQGGSASDSVVAVNWQKERKAGSGSHGHSLAHLFCFLSFLSCLLSSLFAATITDLKL